MQNLNLLNEPWTICFDFSNCHWYLNWCTLSWSFKFQKVSIWQGTKLTQIIVTGNYYQFFFFNWLHCWSQLIAWAVSLSAVAVSLSWMLCLVNMNARFWTRLNNRTKYQFINRKVCRTYVCYIVGFILRWSWKSRRISNQLESGTPVLYTRVNLGAWLRFKRACALPLGLNAELRMLTTVFS